MQIGLLPRIYRVCVTWHKQKMRRCVAFTRWELKFRWSHFRNAESKCEIKCDGMHQLWTSLILYNFNQFVSHTSQSQLTKRNLASVTSHKANWRKGRLSRPPKYSNFGYRWGPIWRKFALVTALEPRWRNENFVRRVTVTHGWQIDWNCTVHPRWSQAAEEQPCAYLSGWVHSPLSCLAAHWYSGGLSLPRGASPHCLPDTMPPCWPI